MAALAARVATLEATLAGVSHVEQGHPTIRFSGVNVQIVDGQDQSTDGDTNGRGNLLIGWNENDGDSRTGSHNLVVGPRHSYVSYGGLIAGYDNATTFDYASVTGGQGNIASGRFSSVTGGVDNSATGYFSSVAGGNGNTASGYYSSVTGGGGNAASGSASEFPGGVDNIASGYYASVAGGNGNTASGYYTSVTGGGDNTASNYFASVTGGMNNTVTGVGGLVSGGNYNTVSGAFDSVAGGDQVTCNSGKVAVCGEGASRTPATELSDVLGTWAAGRSRGRTPHCSMGVVIVARMGVGMPRAATGSTGPPWGSDVTLTPASAGRRRFLGTMILVAAVVGSGIVATNLADDVGVQLLMNMLATVIVLGLLIWTLGPISSAHFNPAVTLVALVRQEIRRDEGAAYIPARIGRHHRRDAGEPDVRPARRGDLDDRRQPSQPAPRGGRGHGWPALDHRRLTRTGTVTSARSWYPPGSARPTSSRRRRRSPTPPSPRRIFTDTFAGIAPASVLPFILAQLVGAALGAALTELFHPRPGVIPEPLDLPGPVHDRP